VCARRDRAIGLEQSELTPNGFFRQIKFYDLRRVPKGDKGARAIFRDRQGNGVSSGDGIGFGEIESLFDIAAGGIEEQNVIGKIVCDQQLLSASGANDRDCSGVRHAFVTRPFADKARRSSWSELLEGQRNQSLRRNLPLGEAVD
jgi:hypothetical protein